MTERYDEELLEDLRQEYEQNPSAHILDDAITALVESPAHDGRDWPEWVDQALAEERHSGLMHLHQEAFDGGDDYALLLAVTQCARAGKPMPEWVAKNFIRCFDNFHNFRSRTLDDAFSVKRPKGTNIPALKKRREKGAWIIAEVKSRHCRGEPIDMEMFESIGRKFAVSGSTARDYYYSSERNYQRKTRHLHKNRKRL